MPLRWRRRGSPATALVPLSPPPPPQTPTPGRSLDGEGGGGAGGARRGCVNYLDRPIHLRAVSEQAPPAPRHQPRDRIT